MEGVGSEAQVVVRQTLISVDRKRKRKGAGGMREYRTDVDNLT